MKAELEFRCDGCGRSSHVMVDLYPNGVPAAQENYKVLDHLLDAFLHEANHEHEEGFSIEIRRPTA